MIWEKIFLKENILFTRVLFSVQNMLLKLYYKYFKSQGASYPSAWAKYKYKEKKLFPNLCPYPLDPWKLGPVRPL